MSNIKNDLLLRAARGEEVERPPIWLMRQAGRILPQYRALRASLSGFKELVKTPALASEVTIQPVDELGVDAAIIFSDILVIPEAMGLNYEMVEKQGPFFPKTIESVKDVEAMKVADAASDIGYTIEAIRQTKKALDNKIPLIGFAGAPWTIFAYMIEGSGSKTFSKARRMLYTEPEASKLLMDKITQSTIIYLKEQIKAGADLVQVFDSWAGILTPEQYNTFALPYLKTICDSINEVPLTVFAKGAWFAINQVGELDCQTVGLDWSMDPQLVRQIIPDKTLQGNLDPCVLYGSPQFIEQETKQMLQNFGKDKYIVNLGHGVYPDTPLDGVRCFIDTVKGS